MNLIKSLVLSLFLSVFFTACGIGGGGGNSEIVGLDNLTVSSCPDLPFSRDEHVYECLVSPDASDVLVSAKASRMFDITIDGVVASSKTIQASLDPVVCAIKVKEGISGETSNYNVTIKKKPIGLSSISLRNPGSQENLIQNFSEDVLTYKDIDYKFFSVMLGAAINCTTCNKEITVKLESETGQQLGQTSVYDGSFEGLNITLVEAVNYIKIITAGSTYSIKVLKNTDVLEKVKFTEYEGNTPQNPRLVYPDASNSIDFNTSFTTVQVSLVAEEGAAARAELNLDGELYKICSFDRSGDCVFSKEGFELNDSKQFLIKLYDFHDLLLANYNLRITNETAGGSNDLGISSANLYIQRIGGSTPLDLPLSFSPSIPFYNDILVGTYATNHDFYYFTFEYDSSLIKGSKTDIYLNNVKLTGGDIAVEEAITDGSTTVDLKILKRLVKLENKIKFIFKDSSNNEKAFYEFTVNLDVNQVDNITGFENLIFKNSEGVQIGDKTNCVIVNSGDDKTITCASNSIYCNFASIKLISKTEESLNMGDYGYMYRSKLIAIFPGQSLISELDSITFNRPAIFASGSSIEFRNYVFSVQSRDYTVVVKKSDSSYNCPTNPGNPGHGVE